MEFDTVSRKVLIIDGYNMIHRCRFSGLSWSGATDGDTQIIYNFFRTLRATVEEFTPDIVYFPLDGRPSKRLAMYPAYKGNRKIDSDNPEEVAYWDSFRNQKRIIIDSIKRAYPIVTVYHQDHECDDLVLHIIKEFHPMDDVVILSSDTDFIQILNDYPDTVRLYNPVSKKYRENTDYDYVSWKAMVGDKADNIPGVRRVGKKTAEKILSTEDGLEERLRDPIFKTAYDKSYSLIKLLDLSGDVDGIEYTRRLFLPDEIISMFNDLKFNSMLSEDALEKYLKTFETLA